MWCMFTSHKTASFVYLAITKYVDHSIDSLFVIKTLFRLTFDVQNFFFVWFHDHSVYFASHKYCTGKLDDQWKQLLHVMSVFNMVYIHTLKYSHANVCHFFWFNFGCCIQKPSALRFNPARSAHNNIENKSGVNIWNCHDQVQSSSAHRLETFCRKPVILGKICRTLSRKISLLGAGHHQ